MLTNNNYCKIFLPILLILVLLSFVLLNFSYSLTLGKKNLLYSDFGKFYHSQQLYIAGKNIYSPVFFIKNKNPTPKGHALLSTTEKTSSPTQRKIIQLAGNLNPPLFTLLTFPLGYLSYAHSLFLWTLISIICGCISILSIQRQLNSSFPIFSTHSLLILIAFLAYLPSFAALQFGQVTFVLFPFLIFAWSAARNQKANLAALILGLATSLKPFIGLFFLYFFMRKEWRAGIIFIVSFLLSTLLTLAFFNKEVFLAYFHTCQLIKWAASSWNVSLYGFLLRFIGGPEGNTPFIDLRGWFDFIYPLFFIGFIGFIMWFLSVKPDTSQSDINVKNKIDLDFSLIVMGMLLLSPLGWIYYFPFLSLPFCILWQCSKKGIYPIALPMALVTLLLLSNIPIPLVPTNDIKNHEVIPVFLGSSLYFGILISFIALLFAVNARINQKKSISFEKIPSKLLLLVCLVTFLPSFIGMTQSCYSWLHHTNQYSSEYTLLTQTKE